MSPELSKVKSILYKMSFFISGKHVHLICEFEVLLGVTIIDCMCPALNKGYAREFRFLKSLAGLPSDIIWVIK